MPLSTSTAVRQLSDGNASGTVLGQGSSDLIGFYGGTPQPQILQGSLAGANGTLSIYTSTQTPANIAANTTTEVTMTVTGVAATDMVIGVNKPASQAGLAVGTSRVSATSTIRVTLGNLTATTITPTAGEAYEVITASSGLQFPTVTLSPTVVAASSVSEQVFTLAGVQPGMVMSVSKPSVQAGLLVTGARAAGSGQVAVSFMNVTAATAITPTASEGYLFFGAVGLRVPPVMDRIQATLTPTGVAGNTTAEQTFTVTGLTASTAVTVDVPTTLAGVSLVGARVSAANTLALNFANSNSTTATPPAGVYEIGFFPVAVPAAGSSAVQSATSGYDGGRALEAMGLLSADTIESTL